MRTSRSLEDWLQEARASSSNFASSASRDWAGDCADAGKAATSVRSASHLRISGQRSRSADLDDVHLGKGIGAVAVDRAALLATDDALAHVLELLVGQVDQRGVRDPERQAGTLHFFARTLQVDESIVRDDRPAARGQMARQSVEERIEQAPAIDAAVAPARQAAGQLGALHRKMRQVCRDQVETPASDRPPQVAAKDLRGGAVAELGEQRLADRDGFVLDVDAVQ